MGIGMVLIVGKEQVETIARHFTRISQKFFFIGNVVKGTGKVVYDAPPAGFPSWIE
jgi:phosphoribosylaminoimidazole (AIR) synthetase